MITTLRTILLRDLDALRAEIESFADDAALWRALPGTANPPGALALHVCGNLRHFIGATLGASGYVRDRDAEFAARDLAREHVHMTIASAREEVEKSLAALPDDAASREYPVLFLDEARTIGAVLAHLSGHLMYHLGQINYARRFTRS